MDTPLNPEALAFKAEYRSGYLDAINDKPRAKQAGYMYNAGYDDGLNDIADEQGEPA